ncbi:MAG: T9SS C-terminal target domain-containing protein [Ignavibacteriales bacterium]|nr:MAG: T9SS C-terminal target domain-containing protein [Ignavibacteriales bacterium]
MSNVVTGIKDNIGSGNLSYTLYQNYPNPFNPNTQIKYSVPKSSQVVIKVFDILGNEVNTLVNEEKPAGGYNVEFRIENLELSSGVYFYQLKAGDYVNTKKMLLLK